MSALGLLILNTYKEVNLNPGKALIHMIAAALYKDDLLNIHRYRLPPFRLHM